MNRTASSLIDLELLDGRVDKPYHTAAAYSPTLERREGNDLLFNAGPTLKGKATTSLLSAFLNLARGRAVDAEAFARKWGGLHLCRAHGLPYGHVANCTDKLPLPGDLYVESIDHWTRLAAAFEALLKIAIAFSKGGRGADNYWDAAFEGIARPDFPTADSDSQIINWVNDPDAQRSVATLRLQIMVRRLIEIGHLTIRFWWNGKLKKFQVDIDTPPQTPNLVGLLTIQLLPLLVNPSNRHGFAMCSDCGRTYRVDRKPNPNRRNYCDRCKRSAWRDSKRELRSRSRK